MIFWSNRKNWRNAIVGQKKVMLEKNQGLRHREGGRWKQAIFCKVMMKTMFLPKMYYFQCLSSKFEVQDSTITINFLLPNADLLKISVFIFFDETYLQKPHCVAIENIPSNKTQLQLRFVLKSKGQKNQFKINSVISVKITSVRAIENFVQAILAHTALYQSGLFIARASLLFLGLRG